MPRQRFDMGSKWLLHNQGKGALLVGGFTDVRRIEPMPGEIVQNRKYPDGLLRGYLAEQPRPHHVLIEVATYAEERALRQATDDLTLSYQTLASLPELLMLVLRPKGKFRIGGKHEVRSKLGLSRLEAEWKPVELWTLPAAEFLAQGDVGVTPWVPLMHFEGPPNRCWNAAPRRSNARPIPGTRPICWRCRRCVGELRFPLPLLAEIFGGRQAMLESPLLQKMIAEKLHKAIQKVLKARFGSVPRDVTRLLREILDEERLTTLNVLAAQCPDLESFRADLLA